MPTGTVKKCYREKGYSFITPDDGSPDIFAPSRSLVGGDEGSLREGLKVMFESEIEARTNKPKAVKWSIIDGSAAMGVAAISGMALNTMAPAAAYGAYGAIPGAMPQMAASPYGAMMPGGIPAARYAPYGAATMAPAGYAAPIPGAMPTAVPGYGAPVAAAPLPAGWEQGPDPTTGKMYYFNRTTGESSWTPPVAPVAAVATAPVYGTPFDPAAAAAAAAAAATAPALAAAPALASAAPAPAEAQAQPAAAAAPDPAAAAAATAPAPALAAAAPEPVKLPEGWETTTDPTSGRPYYFNRATGETTWSPPPC